MERSYEEAYIVVKHHVDLIPNLDFINIIQHEALWSEMF